MVSIIIPIYNIRDYLPACLTSVAKQSYPDLEIILVNDGSTDGSEEICRNAAELDPRIRFINQKNRGLSAARNSGLAVANGEYIMFVDGDDFIRPDMVSILVRIIGYNDMAMCRYCVTDNQSIFQYSSNFQIAKWSMDDFWEAYYNGFRRDCVVVWNKLFKAEVIKEYRFPTGRIHEDEFMINHIMEGKRTIALCNEALYYYRMRPGSIMTQPPTMDYPDALTERILCLLHNKQYKLAKRTVIYALYDLKCGGYPYREVKAYGKRFYRLGMDMRWKTPSYRMRLTKYKRWIKQTFGRI